MTPVEQLIGWRWGVVEQGQTWMRKGWLKKNAAFDTHSGREAARPPEWIPASDRAEVDDLAGWLDDNGYDARPPYDQPITERPCWLEVSATHLVDPPRPGWCREVCGSTIRDALVAAVRVVSKEGT